LATTGFNKTTSRAINIGIEDRMAKADLDKDTDSHFAVFHFTNTTYIGNIKRSSSLLLFQSLSLSLPD
jgi:hypothetical protein